ncbi:LOW QUALITY PROTEIN: hypothetical protein GHT06_004507 [Daphnia sinensis]|uniref:Tandem-95 repeat protein n=1 Tax=Daphnia sinensis TaxID=1820382 RepID=A0AAD5KF96_9CRUS|nr:LOW QUALITY PROTEIN: hypothetical protein GHT06_004507 [Daphnia sinensis]
MKAQQFQELCFSNDSDLENNNLSVSQFTIAGVTYPAGTIAEIPNVGSFVINANGTYTFTPEPNYTGSVPVATYTLSDGNGGSSTATLSITMNPINDAPVVVNETVRIPEDTVASGNLLSNDTDEEGTTLTISNFTVGGQTYPVGQSQLVPGTLSLSVSPVNDAPTVQNETLATPQNTVATGNVLTNDKDVDGDVISITQFTIDTNGDGSPEVFTAGSTATIAGKGTLVINADGSFAFTPATNYYGSVPVATYQVSDGTTSASATLNLSVSPVDTDGDGSVLTPSTTWTNADCDGDGTTNGQEVINNTGILDPCAHAPGAIPNTSNLIWQAADCDSDGETNGTETTNNTNPNDPCSYTVAPLSGSTAYTQWAALDCDGDGLNNATEILNNTDQKIFIVIGWFDNNEEATGINDPNTPANPDGDITNPLLADSDGDGVSDAQEALDGTNPNDGCSYNSTSQTLTTSTTWNNLDCDNDGETMPLNVQTILIRKMLVHIPLHLYSSLHSWSALDCDGDGVTNGVEITNNTDPKNGCSYVIASQDVTKVSTAWSNSDCDSDGLTNGEEATGVDNPTTLANPDGDITNPLLADTDGDDCDNDGETNATELASNTNPQDACSYTTAPASGTAAYTSWSALDCDGDGVTNGVEITNNTDPKNGCSYVIASQDITKVSTTWSNSDCDSDGLTNGEEATGVDNPTTLANPDGEITNPLLADTDGDGVSDAKEALDGTNPNDGCSYNSTSQTLTTSTTWNNLDCDKDGETNATELANNTNPQDACSYTTAPASGTAAYTSWSALDCDGCGVTNGVEITNNTDPKNGCSYVIASQDITKHGLEQFRCDSDGLTNGEEATGVDNPTTLANPDGDITNPLLADTDGDGVSDYQEAIDGTNPNDGCSYLSTSQTLTTSTTWNNLDCDKDGETNATERANNTNPQDACSYTTAPASGTAAYTSWSALDCDGDGVTNGVEITNNTDPKNGCSYVIASQDITKISTTWSNTDCDSDGLTNGEEATGVDNSTTLANPIGKITNPLVVDTDGDGVSDYQEALDAASQVIANVSATWKSTDCDSDGLNNGEELTGINDPATPTSPNGEITNPLNADSDGDGVSDKQEAIDGTDPNILCDYLAASQDLTKVSTTWSNTDCDSDGLTNGEEATGVDNPTTTANPNGFKTNPIIADTDGDGNPDNTDPHPTTPTATNDSVTVIEGNPVKLNILANDDYLINDGNTITQVGGTAQGREGSQTPVDLNVTDINVPVSGNVATNDLVPAGTSYGTPLADSDNPAGATITMNPDGSYDFKATEPGVYNFMVPVCLAGQTSNCPLSPLQITVLDPMANDNPPVVNPDVAVVKEGQAVNIAILNNDQSGNVATDLLASTLSITDQADNGTVTINADGTVTYIPNAGFVGTDTFTYKVCDDANPANCQTAGVTVTVLATIVGDKTLAADDYAQMTEDADGNSSVSGNVLINDSNTNSAAKLSASLVEGPTSTQGTLVFNADGTYVFTAAPGFSGPVEIIYTVCDAATPANCATATLHILVEPAPPVIPVDFNVTDINVSVSGNVSTNDVVPAGTTYGTPIADTTNPAGATLTMNADGTYEFKATAPGVYTYMVPICEPGQTSDCPLSPLQITVLDPMANDNPPVVNPDIATAKENSPVTIAILSNDQSGNVGTELDPKSLAITDQADNGTVTINADGTVTYTPKAGFVGTDTFTYKVCDSSNPAICQTAEVTVTVLPSDAKDVTTAPDDYAVLTADANGKSSVSGNVLTNDDSTNPNAKLTASLVEGPTSTQGTLVFNADGSYVFTPAPGFSGPLEVIYTVCDAATPANCATATLHILVEPAPQIVLDVNVTDVKVAVNGNVSTNDVVPEGTTYGTPQADTTNKPGASITMNPDGTYVFKANLPGVYHYMVPVCAAGQTTDCPLIPLQITVLDPALTNNVPVVNPDVAQTKMDTQIQQALALLNSLKMERTNSTAKLSASLVNGPTSNQGTIVFNADGTYTFTAAAGFSGPVDIIYTFNLSCCHTTVNIPFDVDGDGVSDEQEAKDGTDPFDSCSYKLSSQDLNKVTSNWTDADCDQDGLTNAEEVFGIDNPATNANPNGVKTNLFNPDTDGDGVSDAQEAIDGTNPNDGCSYKVSSQDLSKVSSAWSNTDCDGDGLSNGEEATGIDNPSTPANPNGIKN